MEPNEKVSPEQKEDSEMDIPEKTVGKVIVLSISGRLNASVANDVERKLNSLISSDQVRLVMELGQLEYISSSGLRVLLAALKRVKKEGGDIRLASLQTYVKEVFDIAGFIPLFRIFDKEGDAVESFE